MSPSLDVLLLACAACAAVQVVPLPPAIRDAVSPHASAVDEALRFDARGGMRPLSVDPASTARALGVAAMTIVAFWTARETFARGGIRPIARTVCWAGFAVSVVAMATRYASPRLLYGIWAADTLMSPVYGPFVNRNHMATWLVMALPLAVGYLTARIARRGSVAAGLDALSLWIGGAVCAMFAALVVSLSRSGAVGMGAAVVCGGVIALARRGPGSRRWLAAAAVVALALFASMPISSQLLARFDRLEENASGGRLRIWVETLPIVRDFTVTGVGLGAYRTAMLVYQRWDRTRLFNQAHDEYLQVATEGGLLVTIPVVAAAAVMIVAIGRRLKKDQSHGFWIRAGAVSGLLGVMVQNIWDTGLRMPANGLLFAVLCAIAVHGRPSR
jgi:O-antigen ligase